jgi:hypothetical protein
MAKPIFSKRSYLLNGERSNRGIEDLKEKISYAPMLKFPNFTKPFEVHTNANDFTIGEVHMQNGHPIAFEYKKLCDG